MADEIKLYVDGKEYAGWKEVSLNRALTAVAGKFEVSVTDSWEITNSNWTLAPGKTCQVKIGDEIVLTGYIDRLETTVSGTTRTISVGGRDKTADLVDCSVPPSPSFYAHKDLFTLCQTLAKPFGITVVKQADVGAVLPTYLVQTAETVYSILEKLARRRGVLLTTNGLGQLVIVKVGALIADVGLVQGQNIKSANLTVDHTQRFKTYYVKSQIPGTDDSTPEFSSGIDATATDPGITRYRPMVMMAEEALTPAQSKTRIQWEAAFRASEGTIVEIEVVGWRQKDGGKLWAPNMRVNLDAPAIGLRRELLIGEVSFSQSETGGTITKLKLARKDAYQPKPEVDPLQNWANGEDVGT
jgi:prophage tail gpP-like protein